MQTQTMVWLGILAGSSFLIAARILYKHCYAPPSNKYIQYHNGIGNNSNHHAESPLISSLTLSPSIEKILSSDILEDIREKWNKPLASLPVHIDIPRLIKKIQVVLLSDGSQEERIVFSVAEDDDEMECESHTMIRDLLLTLTQHIYGSSPTQSSMIETQFDDFFPPKVDVSVGFLSFMQQTIPDSNIVNVLKACTQSSIAPAVLKMKFSIGTHFRFKDVRGSWSIRIELAQDTLDPRNNIVRVVHSKSEMAFDEAPEGRFEFRWTLSITFNADASDVLACDLVIQHMRVTRKMLPANARRLEALVHPYMQSSSDFTITDLI